MNAAKVTENRAVFTVEEAVNFAIDAAQEAYDAAKESGLSEGGSEQLAAMAFRNCMPLLETKPSVKCYIACVAQGVSLGFIKGEDARLMMYGAQIWMQVENGKPSEAQR
jgi:hypothetical protein